MIIPFNKRCSESYLFEQKQQYCYRKSNEELRISNEKLSYKLDEILQIITAASGNSITDKIIHYTIKNSKFWWVTNE